MTSRFFSIHRTPGSLSLDMRYSGLTRRKFMKTILAAGSAAAVNWTAMGAAASQVRDKQRFPVVVIGSGLGGLVSAAYLSKYGFPVTVIEQHRIPGGYATSFDRAGGRFTFDVSLHATVAEHAMPERILKDLGIWHRIETVYTPELRRIIAPGFDVTLPAKDPDGVKQDLSRVFPDEAAGIHRFYSDMEQVIRELWYQERFQESMMEKLSAMSLETWMNQYVADPDVKRCLAVFSGYYGKSPRDTNALFYAIATGEYLVLGGQYYKTRSQDLSDALADMIEAHGGTIRYETRVDRVEFDSAGQVCGVTDESGENHPAKAVVGNCSAPRLIHSMIPGHLVPAEYRRKIIGQKPSISSFVVWLGLNREISHIKDYEIDIFGDPGSDDPGFGVNIYDNLYEGYSLPGTSTLSLITLSDYSDWTPYAADYFKGRKAAYNTKKQQMAKRLVQRLEERLIPGLSRMIEVMEIGTPLTNERYTGNPGGAIYGFDSDTGTLDVRTPVKGVYLAGAWAAGGGYTPVMMSGRDAAKAVLKDFQTT